MAVLVVVVVVVLVVAVVLVVVVVVLVLVLVLAPATTMSNERRCCRTMFFGRALAQAPSSHAHNPNPIHIPKRVGMCAIPGRRETQVSIPSLLHRALVWS